ncbi:MAG: hypothetical protein HKL97_00100, partial [Acidocella sp.]
PPAPPTNGPPVALAFPPGSALLPAAALAPIKAIAAERVRAIAAERVRAIAAAHAKASNAHILAGGFGSSFALALARAQRLGEALTAAGVPASAIKLVAQPSGSGGFVQLVY